MPRTVIAGKAAHLADPDAEMEAGAEERSGVGVEREGERERERGGGREALSPSGQNRDLTRT